jgi:GNAT superfamily N-acetyltransferase
MESHVLIEPVHGPDDFSQAHHCIGESFGRQTRDAVWLALNPAWDTPRGQLLERWKSTKRNKDGRPNTVFLKATLPDPKDDTKRRIVGMAIWQQASFVHGCGDPPSDGVEDAVKGLSPTEARFARQMLRSLWKRRIEVAKEKMKVDPPAIFVLDMCVVDPGFQRRGIAGKLVQWAKARGYLECTTEASSMGRGLYMKLGFKPEGDGNDLIYEVDEEFKSRDKPPNVFLRTGNGS